MGYMVHHAIVVTAYKDDINAIRKVAKKTFGKLVSGLVCSNVNGYKSFFVAPDGSKAGWDESDKGDSDRNAFIEWLKKNRENRWCEWAEIQYGDDEGSDLILRHSE
jgi:hypothetical protein